MDLIFSSATGAFDNVVLDVEHFSCRKYLIPQQVGSDQNVLHTYFSRQSNEIRIRTKHFSRFRILCPTHGDGGKTFEGSLRAVVYARQKEIRGKTKVDVSIALDAFSSYDREDIVRFPLLSCIDMPTTLKKKCNQNGSLSLCYDIAIST